jgi:transcriptional regulator GlxA family with amidase domain
MLAEGLKPIPVGILGFDGVTALDLAGPLEALVAARAEKTDGKARACYDTAIIGVTGRSFISESGLVFKAASTLLKAPKVDTLIIPGGAGMRAGQIHRRVADWLATHANQIRRIVCVCTGIYPLAQSGLLDGRRVTTHWRFVQELRRRFPKLRVDHASSFIRDGPFYTCGGGTAPVEMTLGLIEEDYGTRAALSVARELVMRLRPPGDKENGLDTSQFECAPVDRLAELPAWIGAHLDENLCVEALAKRACLCPRHFSRLFKSFFKATPAAFVERLRLDEARRRLLLPRHSVENVAGAVGFKNADTFRRAFERRYGISPISFRRNSPAGSRSTYDSHLFAA